MESRKIKSYQNLKISDSDVIFRILNGEKELFEILLRRNNQILYRVVRSYLKEEKEIEDVMQNTYLKAYEKLHQFKNRSKFSTWLIRIGINEALMRLKSKMSYLNIHDSKEQLASLHAVSVSNFDRSDPEKIFIGQEAKQLLEQAIDALDSKYKSVYMLREIEAMSISEVSKCLQLSSSNVKVRLHRSKKLIKENLYQLSSKKELFEFGFTRCDLLVEKVMQQLF